MKNKVTKKKEKSQELKEHIDNFKKFNFDISKLSPLLQPQDLEMRDDHPRWDKNKLVRINLSLIKFTI